MKKKRKVAGWNDEGEQYYIWDTVARLDGTPAANMYHFVADANDLIVFPERDRPCVTLVDGTKITEIHPSLLVPRQTLSTDTKEMVWVWRMSPKYDPKTWIAEVKRSGEIVCWAPGKKWVEAWVNKSFRPIILIAQELQIGTPVGLCFAAFRPRYVYYPYNDNSNPQTLQQIDHYGAAMTERRVRVANTLVYTSADKTAFIPLSTKAI